MHCSVETASHTLHELYEDTKFSTQLAAITKNDRKQTCHRQKSRGLDDYGRSKNVRSVFYKLSERKPELNNVFRTGICLSELHQSV